MTKIEESDAGLELIKKGVVVNKKVVYLCVIIAFLVSFAKPPSLKNLGVSCYSNATVQALYNIAPFSDILIANEEKLGKLNDLLIASYINLISSIRFEENIEFNLEIFYKEMNDAIEACDRQEDASNMLTTLFRHFFDPKVPEGVSVELNDLIDMGEQSTIACPESAESGAAFESLNFASQNVVIVPIVSVNGIFSLENSLSSFLAVEEGLEYGKIKNCKKQIQFVRASPFLIVQLRRYQKKEDPATKEASWKKDTQAVVIPEVLNFANIPNSNIKTAYTLIGAIVHSGEVTGGHYTAYVQDQYEFREGNANWYHCNDDKITDVGTKFKQFQSELNNGYIFFYRRLDYVDPYIQQPKKEEKYELADSLKQLSTDLMGLAAVLA